MSCDLQGIHAPEKEHNRRFADALNEANIFQRKLSWKDGQI